MTVGTTARYFCGDEERRATLRDLLASGGTSLNGIDWLEVIDHEAMDQVPAVDPYRQRLLLVVCFAAAPADFEPDQTRITGGERIEPVTVNWVRRLDDVHQTPGSPQGEIPAVVATFLQTAGFDRYTRSQVLVLGTDAAGDFSRYCLELVNQVLSDPTPHSAFDPRLASVEFSFKVECPSPFDCKQDPECPPDDLDEPVIDYLAKDYHGFRRLMLDRMSTLAPDWKERNPADLGVALVEMLAYQADRLSYFQDAVATEAYLGTARRRISVRRHARLVDYYLDEGANARAWIVLSAGNGADGQVIPGPTTGVSAHDRTPGTRLLSRRPGQPTVLALTDEELRRAQTEGAIIFETLHDLTLRPELNTCSFYTWSDKNCCLPVGSTTATLQGDLTALQKGDFLLLEEVKGPHTGAAADADPAHRIVVRVVAVEPGTDPLTGEPVTEVRWHDQDALPFPLCLSAETEGGVEIGDVSIARGNVVLADHGLTLSGEDLGIVPGNDGDFNPGLGERPLTHAVAMPDGFLLAAGVDRTALAEGDIQPAAILAQISDDQAEPAIWLDGGAQIWEPRRDLLSSGSFAQEFVAEIEDDGGARLRFGDDIFGRRPESSLAFTAHYRRGNGVVGNVGSDSLQHIVLAVDPGLTAVTNPLPGTSGREPEDLEEARQYAPQAFRYQERAVTEADYAEVAERHPEVAKAAATFRWTGSWLTAFVTVDRRGGLVVDSAFEDELVDFLNRYRLAGFDLEVDAPRFVSLDVAITVCVKEEYESRAVEREIVRVLGSGVLPDGTPGLFHPDHWTFASPVYLSQIYGLVMEVAGVRAASVTRFQRWDRPAEGELDDGVLPIGRLEIARLDNDLNRPENGRLALQMEGGR